MSHPEPPFTLPGNTDFPSEVAGRLEAGSQCPYCPKPITIGTVIRVCPRCRAIHHNACWRKHERCGGYDCSTGYQDARATSGPVLFITSAELDRATPLPARQLLPPGRPIYRPKPSGPVVNRLAITAFVTAVAGGPFFGVVTGLVAVLLATVALFKIADRGDKGKGLAIAAIVLGVIDVVGWIIFLSWALAGMDLRQILQEKARARPPADRALIAPVEPSRLVTIMAVREDHRS